LRARTRPILLYKTVESLVAHQLFEGVGELGSIESIGGWRPSAMVMPAIGHGEGVRETSGWLERFESPG
jgi:hypothetical protein